MKLSEITQCCIQYTNYVCTFQVFNPTKVSRHTDDEMFPFVSKIYKVLKQLKMFLLLCQLNADVRSAYLNTNGRSIRKNNIWLH